MNATAAELGLVATGYRNTHGKTEAGHETTAAEIAKLVRVAMELERFRTIVATRQRGATIESVDGYRRDVVWTNTNRLLPIAGYAGVKTGTTTAAGCCLAAWGKRDGRELVVVVLGSTSSDARYVDARNLFAHGWAVTGAAE
jgi:D-alanyl-D-alanine carboxypeptidase (penicillin-binding protein 5/6)